MKLSKIVRKIKTPLLHKKKKTAEVKCNCFMLSISAKFEAPGQSLVNVKLNYHYAINTCINLSGKFVCLKSVRVQLQPVLWQSKSNPAIQTCLFPKSHAWRESSAHHSITMCFHIIGSSKYIGDVMDFIH